MTADAIIAVIFVQYLALVLWLGIRTRWVIDPGAPAHLKILMVLAHTGAAPAFGVWSMLTARHVAGLVPTGTDLRDIIKEQDDE